MKRLFAISFLIAAVSMLVSCSEKDGETMDINLITTAATEKPAAGATPTIAPTTATAIAPTVTAAPVDYTGKKLVALTFDDGPNLSTTPLVLDKLEKYGVVASFFLIGQNVTEALKPVMERQLALGCELDNHSWSHPSMSSLTAEEIQKQIEDTSAVIDQMVGVTPEFFRPPYIATSNTMYENIDLPFINGIGCKDWEATVTAEERVETILTTVKDGDIILLHDFDGNIATVNALDEIIPKLLEDNYAFVTVSQLFELKGVEPNVEYMIWTNVSTSKAN